MSSRSSSRCAGGVAFVVVIAAALLAPPSAAIAADAVELPATSQRPRTQIPLERALPFFYEANRGQAPDGWDFLVRCTGYHAFVRSDEAVFSFDGAGLSLALDGARRVAPDVRGLEMKAHANYFIGNDPTKWISDVPLSRGAVYRDVAPGTTWRLGASGRRLEFSLVVPGTDEPRFRLAGARTVTVGGDGTLRIAMPTGEATFTAPVAWQLERSGARHTVTARYVVEEDGEFRIALGERDAGRKTFVDPTVSYESYLGGKGDDYVGGAAIDAAGGAYLAGSTLSSDFPTTAGAYDPTPNSISAGRLDAYVVKLSSSGGSLSYATFLGSATKDDIVNSLQVNASGNAFLAGVCYGSDYPTTAGVVAETHTAQYSAQGFVSKLSASGASLAWSTYAPGMGAVEAMAVGPDGSPHLIDGTQLQRLEADASATSFVAEPLPVVDTAGGAGFLCVAVDAADNAFVSGYTSEPEPTASMGAYASPHLGKSDVFVLKMDPNGNVVWSARFGGSLGDNGYAIGVDLHGRPTVTGETTSMDLDVTPDAFQSSRSSKSAGDHDGFLVRLSADGSRLRYSTYFGGNGADVVSCLQVHPGGAAFVAGYTKSTNLPVSGGFQTTYGGGTYDAYILKFTSTGALAWASYVGGAGIDDVLRGGLGAGPDGTIVLGLHTESSDFPTVSPFQSKLASTGDCAFVSVPDNLALSPSATEIVTATLPQWTAGLAFSETLKATGGATPYTWKVHSGVVPPGLTLTTGGSLAGTPSGAGTSTFVVRLTDANDYVEEREFTVRVNPVPTFVAATVPEWTAGVPMDVTLPTNGGTGALVYTVAAGTMPSGLVLTSDGHILGTPADGGTWPYTVKVTDALGVATTKQFTQRVNVRPTIVAQTLPDWTSGRPLETAFATSGGTPPFTWGVSSGQTPAALDSGSGRFSGPARAPRLYAFTLSATDARDVTVTRQFEQAIHAFPAVVTAALPIAAAGRPFRIRLTARDGSAPLVWGHDSGKLPDEVDLDAATGILQGTPSAAVAPTTLVLSVTDASGAHATAELPFECVEGADLSKRRTSAAITLIPGAPTSIRRFIELTLGCTIDVKVTGGIGTDAHPSLRILRADGEPLDLDAGLTATKRDVRLRNLLITETGRYFVAVDAAPGATGVMKVALSITPRSSWTATVPVSTELPDALVRFAAPRGARATAVVKPARNSRARPQLAAWTGADDESLLPGARIRKSGRSVTVSLGRTLDGGDSVLHLAASPATDAGLVVVSIRLKLPKKYSFSLLGVAAGDEP